MNPVLQNIFARRSVRSYREEIIPDKIVRDLLEAAMAAPSACGKDPWHFIVVKDKTTLDRLANGLPYGQMLREAPLGIVVCGDIEEANGNELSYLLQDCSAAIENLLLAASQLGLGGCWLGVHPRADRIEHLRNLFELPEHIIPVSAIALGWPDESSEPRTRYRDEAVHHETW